MKLNEEKERLKYLLKDTITLLCKSGLSYKGNFSVEALIGITLEDNNVLLLNINEKIESAEKTRPFEDGSNDCNEEKAAESGDEHNVDKQNNCRKSRKRRSTSSNNDDHCSKPSQPKKFLQSENSTHKNDHEVSAEGSEKSLQNVKIKQEDVDSNDLIFVKQESSGEQVTNAATALQGNAYEQFLLGSGIPPSNPNPNFTSHWTLSTTSNSPMKFTNMFPGNSPASHSSNVPLTSQTSSAVPSLQVAQFKPTKDMVDIEGNNSTIDPLESALDIGEEENMLSNEENDTKPSISGKSTTSKNSSKKLQCQVPECTYSTTNNSNFKRHSQMHNKLRFPCDSCGKSFSSKYVLGIHVKAVHEKMPPLCKICGKSFTSLGGLYEHRRTAHGSSRYKCDICSKTFNKKNDYFSHVNKHYDVKQLKCSICGKIYKHQNALQAHENICVGEQNFECDICNMTFKRESCLQDHKKGKHGPARWQCKCSKTFQWGASYRRHVQNCNMAQ